MKSFKGRGFSTLNASLYIKIKEIEKVVGIGTQIKFELGIVIEYFLELIFDIH